MSTRARRSDIAMGISVALNRSIGRTHLVSEKEPLLKSPDQLRQLFAAATVTGNKKVVSYCEVGLQASYVYMLARYLGFDAAMYDGSYSEWSDAKQPVIRGDSAE